MFKKIVSLLLIVLMLLSTFSIGLVNVSAATTDDTMQKLESLIKRFPHGKYWNHDPNTANNSDSVTDTPCTHHWNCDYYGTCGCNSFGIAIQCMGFAHKLAYEITGVTVGSYSERSTLDITKLRVGDVIRINNDYHSVCVTGVNGDKISIAQVNYPSACIISWVTVDKSFFNNVTYVLHLEGNERKNSDVTWHDAYTSAISPNEPETPKAADEMWMMPESTLNVYKEKSKTSTKVGTIPDDVQFKVYEKSVVSGSLWAKVNYQGTTGYSILDDAYYISGAYQRPELNDIKDAFVAKNGLTLKWSAVSGADKYKVVFYNQDKKVVKESETTTPSLTFTKATAGNYYVRVYAYSSLAPSWYILGTMKSFRVVNKIIDLEKITLKESGKLDVDQKGRLTPQFNPANATYQDLVWTSSNEKIATVNAGGKVTALAPGKVEITCTSARNSEISASCQLTVRPSSVQVSQVTKGTSENSVGLSWDVSKGVTAYNLYKMNKETAKYEKIATLTENTYTVNGLEPSTEYTFTVRPYAEINGENINAGYKDYTAKTTPTAIEALKQNGTETGKVRIAWEAKEGADAYDIYKYNASKEKYEKLARTTETEYVDTDKSATKLKYKVVSVVKASDGYVKSKASPEFTAITGLVEVKITATKSNASAVKLDWSKVKYATNYQVFKLVDGKKVLLKTLTEDQLTYTDKSLESGTTYTYYVRALRKHTADLTLYSSVTKVKVKTA